MMQGLMNNPELMRTIMMSNPQMQQVMESNPQIAQALNNPEIMRETMQLMQNPVRFPTPVCLPLERLLDPGCIHSKGTDYLCVDHLESH